MTKSHLKRKDVLSGGFEGLKKRSDEMLLKVGILKGTGSYGNGAKLAEVAFWNEYGTKRIPPRPFLRPTIYSNSRMFKNLFKVAIRNVLLNKTTLKKASGEIGLQAQSMVRKEMTDLTEPPNAESTIEIKGSSNPLIDTGRLRQSINFQRVK